LAKKGSRPRVLVTGSKAKTCVSGAVADDGSQLFRQYAKCNSTTFLDYTNKLLKRYKKFVYFIDKAPWHLKTKKVREFFEQHQDRIIVLEFPTGCPEMNPVEPCWKDGKYDRRMGAKFHTSFKDFKKAVTLYYRTKKFNKNLYNYLCL
jgi:transposase